MLAQDGTLQRPGLCMDVDRILYRLGADYAWIVHRMFLLESLLDCNQIMYRICMDSACLFVAIFAHGNSCILSTWLFVAIHGYSWLSLSRGYFFSRAWLSLSHFLAIRGYPCLFVATF